MGSIHTVHACIHACNMYVCLYTCMHVFFFQYWETSTRIKGPFKCYVTRMGMGGVRFSGKKRYEGVRFNVISVTRGWVGVQFTEKKALRNT